MDVVQLKGKDGNPKNEWKLVYDVDDEVKDICKAIQGHMLKAEEDLLSVWFGNTERFPSKVDYNVGPYWVH